MSSEQAPGASASPEYAQLADQYGLKLLVGRPPLKQYFADLWRSRSFIWTLSTTRAYARNENTYLGQLWTILNPLLYAGVYYVIFGKLLGTSKDIENFPAFLVIGVFIFQYTSGALGKGAGAVLNNKSMIKSLRFPRAALPISVVLTELLTLLPALVVMLVFVSLTGEHPTWEWLALPPLFLLITIFNVGVAMLVARLVAKSRDLKNVIPFVTQILRYLSGVFFSITLVVGTSPGAKLLEYQPYALSLELMRAPLLDQFTLTWLEVGAMAGWALAAVVGGLLFFWRGEGTYGSE